MAQPLPYSAHTFVLAFVWKGSSKHTANLKSFSRIFDENPFWTQIKLPDENSFSQEQGHDVNLFYNEYQYFYPQVRSAVYGYDGIVKNYVFAQDQVHNQAHYYIEKKGKTYDLLINQLRLRLYNTGVGLLCLECENHGTTADGKPQNTFADVKNINEFGRRINLPYLPVKVTDGKAETLCADSLALSIPALNILWKTDFDSFGKALIAKADRPQKERASMVKLSYIAGFLKNLLGYGSDFRFTSDSTDPDGIFIHPALDDRMFVASIVNDPQVTAAMIGNGNTPYPFDYKSTLNKSLYEFLFTDCDGGCSCPHANMRQELIQEHLYSRWLPYGSIYGITAQSLVLLHSGSFPPNINNFLTIYLQIAYLCLAQLTSLVVFQKETADLAVRIRDKQRSIKISTVTALMDLQERFSAFEGQFCFDFVSSEEQGVELYDMFRKFFFIDRYVDDVKSQMAGIHQATDTYLDFNFNKIGYIFTLVGAILSIAQLFYAITPLADIKTYFPMIPCLLICAFAVFVILFIYRRRR